MPEPSLNRLSKAVKGLSVAVVDDADGLVKRERQDGIVEIIEQFQVKFEGFAEEYPSFQPVPLALQRKFMPRVQRDAGDKGGEFPDFSYGVELTDRTNEENRYDKDDHLIFKPPVFIHVVDLGKVVHIAATSVVGFVPVSGILHLTYSGPGVEGTS